MKLTLAHFYPELLNLYADRGNIMTIKRRCELRNIDFELINYTLKDEISFEKIDIAFLGGGSDREQIIVCQELNKIQNKIKNFAENNGVILGICGGYQLLGNFYQLENEKIEGLHILNIYTEQKKGRLIGNVIIKTNFGTVVGFENHGGRTYINNHDPLGKVLFGNGNNDEDRDSYEGVLYKNVFGTYLHGPLLPKNPKLADEIITRALNKKYSKEIILDKIDDTEENTAHEYIIKRFLNKSE